MGVAGESCGRSTLAAGLPRAPRVVRTARPGMGRREQEEDRETGKDTGTRRWGSLEVEAEGEAEMVVASMRWLGSRLGIIGSGPVHGEMGTLEGATRFHGRRNRTWRLI